MAYGSTQGTLNCGGGATNPEVQLQKDTEDPKGSHTIMFEASDLVTSSGGAFAGPTWNRFCEALIMWSIGGQTIKRKVSVVHGQSITGVAQNVTVKLLDKSINIAGSPAAKYTATIALAPGTRASSRWPTLFPAIVVPVLAPAAAVTIAIDPDAGAVHFMLAFLDTGAPANYVDGNLSVDFLIGTTVIGSFDPGLFPQGAPIPSGAQAVKITNNSAAETYRLSPVFGIDG